MRNNYVGKNNLMIAETGIREKWTLMFLFRNAGSWRKRNLKKVEYE